MDWCEDGAVSSHKNATKVAVNVQARELCCDGGVKLEVLASQPAQITWEQESARRSSSLLDQLGAQSPTFSTARCSSFHDVEECNAQH